MQAHQLLSPPCPPLPRGLTDSGLKAMSAECGFPAIPTSFVQSDTQVLRTEPHSDADTDLQGRPFLL